MRKPQNVVQAPPPPRRVPLELHSQPPASITIPISIGQLDESVHRAFPPPPRTNNRGIRKNVCSKDCISGRPVSCPDALKSVDKEIRHRDEFNIATSINACSIDGTKMYSANFTKILNKAETTADDAGNMLKHLEMTKLESSPGESSAEKSYGQGVLLPLQEILDSESYGLNYSLPDHPIVSPCNIQPQAFEALKMLYGQDSFYLTQDRAARQRNTPLRDSPCDANYDVPRLSDNQLIELFDIDSNSVEGIDANCFNDSYQGKITSSSPSDLVRSKKYLLTNESREVPGSSEIVHVSHRHVRGSNTALRSDSNCSPDSLVKQAERNKLPRSELLMRSRSCEICYDSSERLEISQSSKNLRDIKSTSRPKAGSRELKRTCSEGVGTKHKAVPAPPPHPKIKSIPLPLLVTHPNKPHSKYDESSDEDDCCLPGSYADMMSLARRMSGNRSLGEPSVLKSPTDEQYWKSLRGRPKSKKQMRGRGQSAKRNKTRCDAYDSSGELSGAETSHISLNSRKSATGRPVTNRPRQLEREKKNQEAMREKSKTLNVRCRSLDRLYSRDRHTQPRGNGNQNSAPFVKKKRFGIASLMRNKKDRLANSLAGAGTGSTDIISGSLSTEDSRSTRRVHRSSVGRKSFESGPSRKSTKSMLFSKRRVMDSGIILSAAADIFQHQCIQVDIDKPTFFDDESSCASSFSSSSEDTSD